MPTIGIFTKEIQRAVLAGDVDFAVHSLKDLPTATVEGLALAAVPPRETPLDALICTKHASLAELPNHAVIGTGSRRRAAQLGAINPTWQCRPVRGNVDTRLRKLDQGECDAMILAAAGMVRLGLDDRIAQLLGLDHMLPAPGQGALALECRSDDSATLATLATLNHPDTHACVAAERALLAHVEGGCMAAVGTLATVRDQVLELRAVVLDEQGSQRLDAVESIAWTDDGLPLALDLGTRVADRLLAAGAAALLRSRN
jgi:hydroxymethylbilane synthase